MPVDDGNINQQTADEESPLLFSEHHSYNHDASGERGTTPLPKVQMSVISLLLLAEPISATCISPFINHLVSELDITGGDKKKVGYYAGLIDSCFYLSQAMCAFQWSRTSDQVGRKPILLIGLAGLSISMTLFGLSRTFLSLVISRSLAGVLNGNVGVVKCLIAEVTDSTNVGQAFSLLPITWAIGGTIAPFAGGALSHPYERFPSTFHHLFWRDHPYLLSCLFSASFTSFSLVVTLLFLKETVHKQPHIVVVSTARDSFESTTSKPLGYNSTPLRDLMTKPILLSVFNYCILAFLDRSFGALQTLFLSTDISMGGLGLDPPAIGTCLGIFGITNGLLQAIFFPKILRRIGPRRVAMIGMAAFPAIFALFPAINSLARAWGLSVVVWATVAVQLALVIIMDMSYGAVFIFVNSSAPNKHSLGSINGMAQTIVSIARAFGPAASTSLFALSIEKNWLGGYAVYSTFIALSTVGISFAARLPREAWQHQHLSTS